MLAEAVMFVTIVYYVGL